MKNKYLTNKFSSSIIINNKCNNNCKYCYEKNKGDQFVTFYQIEKFIKFLDRNNFKKHITFFGGEPSFSLPVMNLIMDKYSDIFTFSMISNGLFINSNDYELTNLRKMKNISISIEGTEEAYKKLRNSNNDLKEFIRKFYEKGFKNITFNLSLNEYILNNINELLDIYNLIKKFKYKIHFYSLKSAAGFNINEANMLHIISEKLSLIKELDKELYYDIINYNNDSNIQDISLNNVKFLCTFDNSISLSSNGLSLTTCAWKNTYLNLGTLNEDSDEDILNNFFTELGLNAIEFYSCNNCDVDPGYCQINCKYYLNSFENTENKKELEFNCKLQHLLYSLFLEEILENSLNQEMGSDD
jgi:sulfatase maturation enzyme AslB (radical SAM superfamily)